MNYHKITPRLIAGQIILLFILMAFQVAAKSYSPSQPLGFIRNAGQFGQNERNTEILFKLQEGNFELYLTTKGLSYFFKERIAQHDENEILKTAEIKWSRVDLNFIQAHISTDNMICEKRHPARITYYKSNGNIINTELNQRIRFKNIYPGIDWVIYMQGRQIKYDFELNVGANPELIQMRYAGDMNISGKEDMQVIEIKNAMGELKEGQLFCHDEYGRQIACKYQINGNIVRIIPEAYNKNEKLIIDPPLAWSTYVGGTSDEEASCLANDAQGNLYAGGFCNSVDFPVSSGTFQGTLNGNQDGFVSKFSNTGELLWSTYLGGDNNDYVNDIQLSSSGFVYIIGNTYSANFPVFAGTEGAYYQGTFAGGNSDAFVSKFSPEGERLWATFYGGNGQDSGNSIAIDAEGNLYFTGASWSANLPTKDMGGNAYFDGAIEAGGFSDAYLVKLSSSGERLWSTYFGGDKGDAGIVLCTDAQRNVFLASNTWSNNLPTLDAGTGSYYQPALSGGLDVFIAKFNSDGELKWATYYGGTAGDSRVSKIATDLQGRIYIVGRSGASNFPVKNAGAGAYFHNQLGGGIYTTPYVMRFSNQGISEWATFLKGAGTGWTYDLRIGKDNHAYITGETRAPDFITLDRGDGSYFQSVNQGSMKYDAFIMEFDTDAKLKWSTLLGGSGNDYGRSLSIDSFNNVFVAGITESTDFPVLDAGANSYYHSTLIGGVKDLFITKFGRNTLVVPEANFSATITCSGDTTFFTDLSTGSPVSWEWNFGDPSSGQLNTSVAQNPWHIFNSGGSYQVQLKVSNEFGTNEKTHEIQVTETVQGSITNLDTVYCNNHPAIVMTAVPPGGVFSGNGVTDNIFLPKEATYGMNLIVYTPPPGECVKPAQVWVRVKSDSSCINGFESWLNKKEIRISPNPFNEQIILNIDNLILTGPSILQVKSLSGQIIWSANRELQQGVNTVEIPGIAPGIYFLQISSKTQMLTLPVMKIRD